MEIICTTCSKRKRRTPGLLPARRRYLSRRIRYVLEQAARSGRPALILSGRFGLLAPDDPILWYDHALTPDEVATLVPVLVEQLRARRTSAVVFHARPRSTAGWEPYHEAIELACRQAGIRYTAAWLGSSFV